MRLEVHDTPIPARGLQEIFAALDIGDLRRRDGRAGEALLSRLLELAGNCAGEVAAPALVLKAFVVQRIVRYFSSFGLSMAFCDDGQDMALGRLCL